VSAIDSNNIIKGFFIQALLPNRVLVACSALFWQY